MDACKPNWKSVRSIDRRIFFLGGYNSFSFTITDDEMKSNCIYILWPQIQGELLYKICLDNLTTVESLVLEDATNELGNLCWVVPSR
jgi:Protein of unknown function (DUF295)